MGGSDVQHMIALEKAETNSEAYSLDALPCIAIGHMLEEAMK